MKKSLFVLMMLIVASSFLFAQSVYFALGDTVAVGTATTSGSGDVNGFVNFGSAGQSISQNIYVEDLFRINGELQTGYITHIKMKYSSIQSLVVTEMSAVIPVQIFMGLSAEQTTFTSASNNTGWIPMTGHQKVFDGTLTLYPTGNGLVSLDNLGEVVVTLTHPYYYNGGNLVMTSHRKHSPQVTGSVGFQTLSPDGSASNAVRYRINTSNNNAAWPAIEEFGIPTTTVGGNTPIGGTTSTGRLVIFVTMYNGPLGNLTGQVTGIGLREAKVSIPELGRTVTTDTLGFYSMPLLPPGTYTIVASQYQYETETSTVTIVNGETETKNFTIDPITVDLNVVSIRGGEYVMKDSPVSFSILVRNDGILASTQFYSIQLLRASDNVVIAERDTGMVNLEPADSHTYTMSFTPTVAGTMGVYAKVISTMDENDSNDQSDPVSLVVLPEGITMKYAGDQNSTTWVNSQSIVHSAIFSLHQNIYHEDQLFPGGGAISEMHIFKRQVNNAMPVPTQVKIWLAHTDKDVFVPIATGTSSNDWVPFEDFHLVYEGPIATGFGEYRVVIPFDDVFYYQGGNLAVMMWKEDNPPSGAGSDVYLQTATAGFNRRIGVNAGMTTNWPGYENPYNPAVSYPQGTMGAGYTNAVFIAATTGASGIAGDITKANGGGPVLPGVKIRLNEYPYIWTLSSDTSDYSFPFLPPATYGFKATRFQYVDQAETGIEVSVGPATTHDFTMIGIDDDLRANNLQVLNFRPTAGDTARFTVVITNDGLNAVTGSEYTVKLFKVLGDSIDVLEDELLVEEDGVPIASLANVTFPIEWIPEQDYHVGKNAVYAYIDFATDTFITDNNITNELNVYVQDENTITKYLGTVGSSGTTGNYPITFGGSSLNAISQYIYHQSEIDTLGYITGLIYRLMAPTAATTAFLQDEVVVSLATIDISKTTFGTVTDWIPLDQFTEVYRGKLTIAYGPEDWYIPFDTPYHYPNNGNLVVMAYRPRIATGRSTAYNFQSTTNTNYSNRGMHWSTTGTADFNWDSPQSGTRPSNVLPNTTFMMVPIPAGSLRGEVTNTLGLPIEGARVTLSTGHTTTTNAGGEYYFATVDAGDIMVYATMNGYTDYESPDLVTIIEGYEAVHHITMESMTTHTLSGVIVRDDNGDPIEGAVVKLFGYQSYADSTDVDGLYSISGIYGNRSYDIVISAAGLMTIKDIVTITDADTTYDVSMIERPFPVHNISAVEESGIVTITWDEPVFEGVEKYFNHETAYTTSAPHGTLQGQTILWGAGYTPAMMEDMGILGADLTHISWYVASDAPPATWKVRVYFGSTTYIVGTSYVEAPGPGTLVYEQLVTQEINRGQWNEVELERLIPLPTDTDVWLMIDFATATGAASTFGRIRGNQNTPELMTYAGIYTTNNGSTWSDTYRSTNEVNMIRGKVQNAYHHTPLVRNGTRNRGLSGYRIYRADDFNLFDEDSWELLEPMNGVNIYEDINWMGLDPGVYRYVVQAVYSDSVLSAPRFSNYLTNLPTSDLTVNITSVTDGVLMNTPIFGGTITLKNHLSGLHMESYLDYFIGDTHTISDIRYGNYALTVLVNGYRAYYDGDVEITAAPASKNITLQKAYTPQNVSAIADDDSNRVIIAWTETDAKVDEWITYNTSEGPFADTNYMGYSGSIGTYIYVNRYDAEQLDEMGIRGSYLTKVSFAPNTVAWSNTNTMVARSRKVVVYTGGSRTVDSLGVVVFNPGTRVYSQLIDQTRLVATNYNEIELTTAVPIPLTGEFWFGIENDNLGGNSYMGHDDYRTSPNNDGYGNVMYHGGVWTTMSAVSTARPAGSWAIKGFFEGVTPATPIEWTYNVYRIPVATAENDSTWLQLVSGYSGLTYYDLGEDAIVGDFYTYIVKTALTDSTESAASYNTLDAVMIDWTFVGNEENLDKPLVTTLGGNYPNPFNPSTTIHFSVATNNAPVQIDIYNIKGQKVTTLLNDILPAGNHKIVWNGKDTNGRDVASGIYFYRMKSERFTATKKMLLMK